MKSADGPVIYEGTAGRLNRRQLLSALPTAGLFCLGTLPEAPAFGHRPFRPGSSARMISIVALGVSDLSHSTAFYRRLFGVPPLTAAANARGILFDGHFISLNPASQSKAGKISFFGLGFSDFNQNSDNPAPTVPGRRGKLGAVTEGRETVTDPDGNVIKIFNDREFLLPSAYGSALGDTVMLPPAQGIFRARKIQHVGITVSDLLRSKTFYENILGSSAGLRPLAPPRAPAYALDFNGYFVSLSLVPPGGHAKDVPGASKIYEEPGVITHFCIGVDNFNAERDGAALRTAGFQNVQISTDLIDCILLPDPDGLQIQISDANYTYQCPTCKPPPV